MSDVMLPKPGIVLGAYPERQDERLGKLDQYMSTAVGWIRQRLNNHRYSAPLFLSAVRRQERSLKAMNTQDRAAYLSRLRMQLRRVDRPSQSLIAKSFALIRTTAEEELRMRPFDVQLLGGLVLLGRKISEMDTGEGKTLTATLPAATLMICRAIATLLRMIVRIDSISTSS